MSDEAAPAAFSDLSPFDVSTARGFLPRVDPAVALPSRFAAWDDAAANLPKLILAGEIRRRLEALPTLTLVELDDGAALRRAMMVLSYLGHAYVWGEPEPACRLPAAIAVPWNAVAKRLDRPPVLSYASYALDNWRRIDPDGPIELGNIAVVQNFLGGADEDWFIAIHVDIEAKAGRLIDAAGRALDAVTRADVPALVAALDQIAETVGLMVAVLRRMPEYCDPYVYYRRVRPYIHGWKNHPAFENGLYYDGVAAFGNAPQAFRGESGAQSSIVPTLDAVLGVKHADDPLRDYLMEMRAYMPAGHRALIEAIEAGPAVRPFVLQRFVHDATLATSYNACLDQLEAFRSVHLEYAATYIHKQSQTDVANPTALGTAGTPFMAYLKKHRDESGAHRVSA
jgi:indoleamine 2,3-dioxygenase